MVLNFGGNALFDTAREETAKGVYSDRLEEAPSSSVAVGATYTVTTSWADITNAEVTISVKPDEKVFVIANGAVSCVTNAEVVEVRLSKDGSAVSEEAYQGLPGGAGIINGSVSVMTLADPGEGVHTYKVQAKSTHTTGGVLQVTLIAFTVGARR